MLDVLAQDPDSGIICYGDTTLRHKTQNDVVLEFMDFYRDEKRKTKTLNIWFLTVKVLHMRI